MSRSAWSRSKSVDTLRSCVGTKEDMNELELDFLDELYVFSF